MHLMAFIDKEIGELKTQIIVVPSLKDIQSMFPLPQPPLHHGILKKAREEFANKVKLAGNPQEFSIGNNRFAAVTYDVVLQLFQMNKSGSGPEKLNRALAWLLEQSMYPLYPSDKTVPVDINH